MKHLLLALLTFGALAGDACSQNGLESRFSYSEIVLTTPAGASVALNVPTEFLDSRDPALAGQETSAAAPRVRSLHFKYEPARLSPYAEVCEGSDFDDRIMWSLAGGVPGYVNRAFGADIEFHNYIETEQFIGDPRVYERPEPPGGIYERNTMLHGHVNGMDAVGRCYKYRNRPEEYATNMCQIYIVSLYINEDINVLSKINIPIYATEILDSVANCVISVAKNWVREQ